MKTGRETTKSCPAAVTRRTALGILGSAALAACSSERKNCVKRCHRPTPVPQPSPPSPRVSAFESAVTAFEASDGAAELTNENGRLAWGQSYVLLGLMRVYETTKTPEYLDTVVQIATRILSQTDRNRGVTDYRGRSGPVWRSAGKYTAWHAPLISRAGTSVIDIRYAGSNTSDASVIVAPGSSPTTFSLTLKHPLGVARVLNVSTSPGHSRFVERAVYDEAYRPTTPWTATVLHQGVPRSGLVRMQPQFDVFAVSTGMITYPLALYARTVFEDHELSSGPHREHAEMILRAVKAAVAFHDPEWSETSVDVAGYISPKGAPVRQDGSYLPFNQSNALGQTMAELYRVTRDDEYADKVTKLARSWRAALRPPRGDGGGQVWSYWPPFSKAFQGYSPADHVSAYTPQMSPTRRLDDLSHSAITVEFVVAALAAGVGVAQRDAEILISTYLGQMRSGEASVRRSFGGPVATATDSVQSARWLGLADRRIAQHVNKVLLKVNPRPTNGSDVLARGYLAWAAGRGLL